MKLSPLSQCPAVRRLTLCAAQNQIQYANRTLEKGQLLSYFVIYAKQVSFAAHRLLKSVVMISGYRCCQINQH